MMNDMKLLKSLIKFVRNAWITFGISALMFVTIELCLSLVFHIRSFWRTPDADYRIKADTHSGASWAEPYYKEFAGLGLLGWKSYVYWRRNPSHGNYININQDGLRKTYSEEGSNNTGSKIKVFMFGGSTLWGAGARDDYTIPSFFAKETIGNGINCEVVNFGQSGYVSTQEVIEMMLQLQKRNIPDVVIFYDGINDTFSAFQLAVAGLPQNEFNREMEFNLTQKKELRALAVRDALKQLSIVRLLNALHGGSG